MPGSFLQQRLLRLVTVAVAACWSGCAGYQLGNSNLYRPDIRTVHVPVFESESLRRNLGERLTEAVIKEVELRTPYKVVSSPDADSVLSGRITRETKHALAQNQNSDARLYETQFVVEVRWANRRGEVLMQRSAIPLPQLTVSASGAATFIPEAGQSAATAQQQTIQRLAEQIVGQMEAWW
ncbi:MAG: LPS assembly lipoprotein LptE [Planctomycetota bacterium]|nr:LPS assembly lipoprotein LptE [Planctomycetota bacterium]